jgi:hypothetical protein
MAFTKKIAGWVAGRIKGEQARKDTMRWMEKTGLGQILDIAGDIALTQGAIKGAGKLKGLLTGGGQAAAPLKALPAPGASTTTVAPRTATAVAPPSAPAAMPRPTLPAPAAAPMAAPVAAPMAAPVTPSPMQAMVAPRATPTAPPPVSAGPTQAATNTFQSRRMLEQSIPTPQARDVFQAPSRAGVQAALPRMAQPEPNIFQKALGAVKGGASATMQYGRENAPLIAATAPAVANVIGAKIEQDIEQDKIKREQEARNRLAMLLMPMFQAQIGQAAPSFQPRG